jgi:hypothetical protein
MESAPSSTRTLSSIWYRFSKAAGSRMPRELPILETFHSIM